MQRLSKVRNKQHHAWLSLPSSPKKSTYDLNRLIMLSFFFLRKLRLNVRICCKKTIADPIKVCLQSCSRVLTEASYAASFQGGRRGARGQPPEHPLVSPITTLDICLLTWKVISGKDHITEQHVAFDPVCFYRNILAMSLLPRKKLWKDRLPNSFSSDPAVEFWIFFSSFGLYKFSRMNMICLWKNFLKVLFLFKCLNMNFISPKERWRQAAGEVRLLLLPTGILPLAALPEEPPPEQERRKREEEKKTQLFSVTEIQWEPNSPIFISQASFLQLLS